MYKKNQERIISHQQGIHKEIQMYKEIENSVIKKMAIKPQDKQPKYCKKKIFFRNNF